MLPLVHAVLSLQSSIKRQNAKQNENFFFSSLTIWNSIYGDFMLTLLTNLIKINRSTQSWIAAVDASSSYQRGHFIQDFFLNHRAEMHKWETLISERDSIDNDRFVCFHFTPLFFCSLCRRRCLRCRRRIDGYGILKWFYFSLHANTREWDGVQQQHKNMFCIFR